MSLLICSFKKKKKEIDCKAFFFFFKNVTYINLI